MQRAEVSNQRKCVMSMFCVLLVGRLWALPKVMLRLDPGPPLLRTVGPSARCPTSPTTGLHQQGQNIIVMTPNEIHTDIIVGQGGCKGLCFVEETKTCCWGCRSKGWKKQRCNPPPFSPPTERGGGDTPPRKWFFGSENPFPAGSGGGGKQPTKGSGCLVEKTTFPLSLGGGQPHCWVFQG